MLTAQLTARAEFERDANPLNDNIQKTITGLMKRMTPGVVKGLAVVGTDPAVVNTVEQGEKRRNVYAIQKMMDLLVVAASGIWGNAINRATLQSMVVLGDHKLPFTGEAAKGCASDKTVVAPNLKALLHRHTVSESTASTQASSTMTALEDLGVVKNVGTRNKPVYELTQTALALRLVELARKSLAPMISA